MIHHLKSSATFILLMTLTLQSQAQCIANAGVDKVVCSGMYGIDTITIGGSPAVSNGVPPYTYQWETSYTLGSFTLTASDFLDDTTLAQPSVISGGIAELQFHLTVKDSLGNTCTDSMRVQFSQFGFTLENKRRRINQGDSVRLYPGFGGGLPPLTYKWTPDYNLSNAQSANPWASPDTTTFYTATATDSAGCKVTDPDVFQVYVNSVGLKEIEQQVKAEIFPNPMKSRALLKIPKARHYRLSIEFYNTHGQPVKKIPITEPETEILRRDFTAGIYFFRLWHGNQSVGQGKLMVQ